MALSTTITTFEDLCQHYAQLVLGEDEDCNRPVLYEFRGDLSWIRPIISRFNTLGFMTWTSQPGDSGESSVYPSLYHMKMRDRSSMIPCVRKQRVYVRGFMEREKAQRLYERILRCASADRLIIRTSDNNGNNQPYHGDIEFGSVAFINDVPIISTEAEVNFEWNEDEILRHTPAAAECFRLGRELPNAFAELMQRECPSMDPRFFDGRIVCVDIFDQHWNDNSLLWSTVLEALESVNTGR